MTPQEIRKLLGGYATGSLTDAEQQALFAAALDDQELFDELAREQSLRELLSDPSARAEMLAAVEERPKVWGWWRPAAAVLAMAGLAAVAVLVMRPKPQPTPLTAPRVVEPPPAPAPAPVPSVIQPDVAPPATSLKTRKTFQPPPAKPAASVEVSTLAEAPKLEAAPSPPPALPPA